ncbi:MAG: TolC family protein [Aquificaceae bacterium]
MKYLILFLLASFCFGDEVLVLDYKKVYSLALENNAEIKRLREQLKALDIDYQLAQRYYYPILYAGASLVYDIDKGQTKSNFDISIISTLYEFQKTKSKIALSGIKRDIAQLMRKQLNRDIQLRIIKLFVDAHMYRKLTEVKREEMAIAYVRFDRAREKRDLGLATDHEVYKLEGIYREKRRELFYAQHRYNNTLLEIKALAGIPYETPVELKDLPFRELDRSLVDFPLLREEALRENTNLKMKSLELKSYDEEIKMAKSFINPSVNLKLSTNKSGLEITTPIYDAGRPYRVEYIQSLQKSVQKEKEGLERDISLLFYSASYEWEYLKARWLEAITKDRFAEENLILRRSEYELELAFDLGYAMAEKSETERQLIEAKYNLILFWAKLFNLAGRDPFKVLEALEYSH